MTKVSIIMPVYNAEDFLEDSINSVLKQTIKDIELICIDDGSTDNSLNILNNLSKKYDFIKVFTQKNQYSGKARNQGIEKSNGDYIAFLDADDQFIDKYALEKMYMYGNSKNAEIVCGNLKRIRLDGSIEKKYDFKNTRFNYFYEKDILEPIEYGIPWAFYKNIYKTSFIKEHTINFPDLKRGQDPIFLANILTKVDKIYVMKVDLYGYNHSVNDGVNAKVNDYTKKYDYVKHFKNTMDILEKAGFESPLAEFKREFFNYLGFKENIFDEDLRKIVPEVFGDISSYFDKNAYDYIYLDALLNQEDENLNEFKQIKRCLFEEVLISDNFIDADMLRDYIRYNENLKDDSDIASIKELKSMEKDINNYLC